jgi:hypothetical protein
LTQFQIALEKVRQRADFFVAEAQQQCSTPRFAQYEFGLSRENAELLAEAYFLVNEAFKERRQEPGRRTQPPKIAAITCVVVATLNPLRPKRPPASATVETLYANPMFAMRLGCSIVGHPFHRRSWVEHMWFCDGLRSLSMPCLHRYIEAARNETRVLGAPYELDLSSDELRHIESRVGLFTVLGDLKVYKADSSGEKSG